MQGLPGPAGEKGETGDVGQMVRVPTILLCNTAMEFHEIEQNSNVPVLSVCIRIVYNEFSTVGFLYLYDDSLFLFVCDDSRLITLFLLPC